jgi:hypothetical protein
MLGNDREYLTRLQRGRAVEVSGSANIHGIGQTADVVVIPVADDDPSDRRRRVYSNAA